MAWGLRLGQGGGDEWLVLNVVVHHPVTSVLQNFGTPELLEMASPLLFMACDHLQTMGAQEPMGPFSSEWGDYNRPHEVGTGG